VIEAVQRDTLDSMGSMFEHFGDDASGRRLSSKKPPLSSRLSSRSKIELITRLSLVELPGIEPGTYGNSPSGQQPSD
jgi:hypothetical protein